ncbi:MAG: MarR family transcriptional regulator [Bacteroidota bacterium]|nr:MarR family transcriptional regulator [Bacteroidota bacterium]
MDASELVMKTLNESKEAMKSGDIADKSGLDKKDVDKAIKKLVADEKVFSPKRCFYAVKQ